MAESSRFYTTGSAIGDAPVGGFTSTQFQEFIRTVLMTTPATEGVLPGIANALACTGVATPVTVATGAALVYGLWYQNDAAATIAVATPAVNPRIDLVVLRANMANSAYTAANSQLFSSVGQAGYTVRMDIIKGVENVSPTAPALTQNSNQWEIKIAQLQTTTGGVITNTDARTYRRDASNAQLASIDDTMAGNRVATLTRRQGGSATDWGSGGSTNYTPALVKMQAGRWSYSGSAFATITQGMTFPVAFSAIPLMFATVTSATMGTATSVQATIATAVSITASSFTIGFNNTSGTLTACTIDWLAIGPP